MDNGWRMTEGQLNLRTFSPEFLNLFKWFLFMVKAPLGLPRVSELDTKKFQISNILLDNR